MVISGFLRGGAGFLEGVGGAGADERLGKVLGDGGGRWRWCFWLGWVGYGLGPLGANAMVMVMVMIMIPRVMV